MRGIGSGGFIGGRDGVGEGVRLCLGIAGFVCEGEKEEEEEEEEEEEGHVSWL